MTLHFLDENQETIQWFKKHENDFIKMRQFFHENPELSKKEFATTDKINELLESWGIKTDRSFLETGVIGLIKKGTSSKRIGLRADIDALPIDENTDLTYKSKKAGIMHACGHDGHLAMLLFAAKYLQETADFDGEILLIFQPNEEDSAGARDLIEAGLFKKYPVDAVYAMHNFPGADVGTLLICDGPQMAGTVSIEIDIHGIGCHAAHPYKGVDPIVTAAQVIVALQSIPTRNMAATDSVIITIGTIHGGTAHNVIPETVKLTGTLRYFDPKIRELTKKRIHEITEGICTAFGGRADVRLQDGYIATVNHTKETEIALKAAQTTFKSDAIATEKTPSMGAEDFGFMLADQKGAYFYIGNGPDSSTNKLHNAGFDFDDRNLLYGGVYWSVLAQYYLDNAQD